MFAKVFKTVKKIHESPKFKHALVLVGVYAAGVATTSAAAVIYLSKKNEDVAVPFGLN